MTALTLNFQNKYTNTIPYLQEISTFLSEIEDFEFTWQRQN